MRLINAETLEFEEFLDPASIKYAILSHTWEAEEVTLTDMINRSLSIQKKAGFVKIQETCRLARLKGLKYVWIDTCCIDKTSSAELSEAINSMFNWYAQSAVCFAQLSDLGPGVELKTQDLEQCRWFRRGWTLQELIAPLSLELYDAEWKCRGTKHTHWQAIQDVTGISKDGFLRFKDVLDYSGDSPKFPVAQRMYWASRRETTRPEDMAYCLFGLFDVNMPLLYGEGGTKAFLRLQSAILEATQDLSILAWKHPPSNPAQDEDGDAVNIDQDQPETACGVLAPHPKAFDHAVSRLFETDMGIHREGAELLGHRPHADGTLLRIKAPRLTLLNGEGDQIFLYTGLSLQTAAGRVFRLWIPLAQLGNTYGRAHAMGEPVLDSNTRNMGCVPLEEMALISNPSRTLDVGDYSFTVKFDAAIPEDMVVHGLDACPKASWNALTQVFSLPRRGAWDVGYLGIRLRRLDEEHRLSAMGSFHKPS